MKLTMKTFHPCRIEANAPASSVRGADSATRRARLSPGRVPRDTTVLQGPPLLCPVRRSVNACRNDDLLLVFSPALLSVLVLVRSRAPTLTSLVVALWSTAGCVRLDTTVAEPVCPTPRASVTQGITAHLEPPQPLR